MYHLSDLKLYTRCKRLFWLNQELHESVRQPSLLRVNEPLDSLLTRLFDIDELFIGIPHDTNERFLSDQQHQWFFQVRLEYSNLRVKTPLMHRQGNNIDLYFTVLLPNPTANDAISFTVVCDVLEKLGFMVDHIYMIHTNPEYVRQDTLDVKSALVISQHFYNDAHKTKEHIHTWVNNYRKNLDRTLADMEQCLNNPVPKPFLSAKCTRRPRCVYYEDCFGADVYDNHSVFNLYSSKYREDLQMQGVSELKNITNQSIEGLKQQYAQVMADREGGEFFDQIALTYWIKKVLKYPLAFVDFEWETFALPPYRNMKSLSVVPFQYSLDVMDKNDTITHYDYLGINDTRLEFIQSLINNMPKTGSIIAFNADGAEKLRLKELAEMFPEYADELSGFIKRMVDLSIPFNNGLFYNIKQRNGFSLKTILTAISDISHNDLTVSDGVGAIIKWRKLEKSFDQDTYQELLDYCRLDTMGMVLIYRYLKNLVE